MLLPNLPKDAYDGESYMVSISRAIGIEPAERKAMALKKKATAKWRAWNKGLEVGQKGAFTPAQVKRIRQVLADRGIPGLGIWLLLGGDRHHAPGAGTTQSDC